MSSLLERGEALPLLPEAASINGDAYAHNGARWTGGLWFIVGLNGIFIATILILLALTRFPEPSNLAILFGINRCGDLACFRGLIPNVTPWAEAKIAFNYRTTITFDPPDGEIRLTESRDGTRLGRILIHLPNDSDLLVSDVVLLFGPPCGVSIYPQARKFILQYPSVQIVTFPNQNALSPNTPIRTVEFRDNIYGGSRGEQACFEDRISASVEIINRRWRGFASLDRYMTGR